MVQKKSRSYDDPKAIQTPLKSSKLSNQVRLQVRTPKNQVAYFVKNLFKIFGRINFWKTIGLERELNQI